MPKKHMVVKTANVPDIKIEVERFDFGEGGNTIVTMTQKQLDGNAEIIAYLGYNEIRLLLQNLMWAL